MAEKLKAFSMLVAHTLGSVVAAVISSASVYSTLRPILGRQRYSQFAHTPLMWMLLFTGIALVAMQVYRRWPDRRAFFAWLFPAMWVCHLILSRGFAEMEGKWEDRLLWFGIGAAYSAGAFITSLVTGKILQKIPAELPEPERENASVGE